MQSLRPYPRLDNNEMNKIKKSYSQESMGQLQPNTNNKRKGNSVFPLLIKVVLLV